MNRGRTIGERGSTGREKNFTRGDCWSGWKRIRWMMNLTETEMKNRYKSGVVEWIYQNSLQFKAHPAACNVKLVNLLRRGAPNFLSISSLLSFNSFCSSFISSRLFLNSSFLSSSSFFKSVEVDEVEVWQQFNPNLFFCRCFSASVNWKLCIEADRSDFYTILVHYPSFEHTSFNLSFAYSSRWLALLYTSISDGSSSIENCEEACKEDQL